MTPAVDSNTVVYKYSKPASTLTKLYAPYTTTDNSPATGKSQFYSRTKRKRPASSKTPDYWGKLKRQEFIPPRAFSHTSCVNVAWDGPSGQYYYNTRDANKYYTASVESGAGSTIGFYGDSNTSSSGLGELSPTLLQHPAAAYAKAKTEALLALKDQKVNLAQAFAERAQTARLFKETVTRITKAVFAVKRGKFSLAAKALAIPQNGAVIQELYRKSKRKTGREIDGAASANWLMLQYGWKPLLSDVEGAAVALAKREMESPDRYRFNGIGKAVRRTHINAGPGAKWGSVTIIPSGGYYTWCDVDAFDKSTWGGKVFPDGVIYNEDTTRCRLDACIDPNNVTRIASGLGVTNPVSLAWEVLPFSFVVDWFIPIGDYLGALDASLGITYLGGSTTTKRVVWGESWLESANPGVRVPGNGKRRFEFWFSKYSYTEKHELLRTVETTLVPPRPSLDKDFSPLHFLNGLALLGALTGNKSRPWRPSKKLLSGSPSMIDGLSSSMLFIK